MDDKNLLEYYFKIYQELNVQGRHYETQRTTIITAIIAISGAIIGIITFDTKIESNDFLLAIFLLLIGVFGTGFLIRHSIRLKKHITVIKNCRESIGKIINVNSLSPEEKELFDFEDAGWISMRKWWIGLSLSIVIIGIYIIHATFPKI